MKPENFNGIRESLIQVFEKYNCQIIKGSEIGGNFISFKTGSGAVHKGLIQILNLDSGRSIKINKSAFDNEIKPNSWVILVLIMDQMKPVYYMIPMKVFESPNDYFIDNRQPERLSHMSNWEIKVYLRMIPQLNEYLLESVLTCL